MIKPMDIKEKIIKGLNIDKDTVEFNNEDIEDTKQFFWVEGEDLKLGTEVTFLIYNCAENGYKFDIEVYKRVIEKAKKERIFLPVVIFNDLDHETKIRTQLYDDAKKADVRKEINKYFDEKISIYIKIEDEIEIEVEEKGINYLEYKTMTENTSSEEKHLEGYIYNISYLELKKILNVTGKNLFKENVRIGLEKNKIGKKLKKTFKDYIKVGIFQCIDKELKSLVGEEKLLEVLGLSSNDIKVSSPEKFWFYHNGVTIYSYNDKKVERSNNKIKLNPNSISVINGAQTVTNFYNAIKELEYELVKSFSELKVDDKYNLEWINDKIFDVCNKIKIKTIIIDGSKEYVNGISVGLNTQIPINDKDIYANSECVNDINSHLKKAGISIVREGEVGVDGRLSVLEYVKKYLIMEKKPGKSKNFNVGELNNILVESKSKCVEDNFANKLKMLIELDKLWNTIIKNDGISEESNKEYCKYGKNYFGSYLIINDIGEINKENVYSLFKRFIKAFKSIQAVLGINTVRVDDFKSDNLFSEYIKKLNEDKKVYELSTEIDKIDLEKMLTFLQEDEESDIYKKIANYLDYYDIVINNYKVIILEESEVKNSYDFQEDTFSELYLNKNDNENVTNTEFENSKFAHEINKKFPVLIVEFEDFKKNKIRDIRIIPEFSFETFNKDAKEVYDKTKEAFDEGDENAFVKSNDDFKFYVRIDTSNDNETFEFSNGEQISRRTFAAKKETVEELLSKFQQKN